MHACKSKIEYSAVWKDWKLAVLGWDWGIGGLGMDACKSKIEYSAVLKDWESAVLGDQGCMLVKLRLRIRLF